MGSRRSSRILLVEDDASISTLLGELLAELGHTVCETATTEAQAVAAAARLQPSLMIVDVNLAQGDGISAMRTILQTRQVPHLFMAGAPVLDLPRDAVVLRKPFYESDLVRALEIAWLRAS